MLENRRIAVIDDDDRFRSSMVALLRSFGSEARAYPSADSFLADADCRPDCVISDVQMPGKNGFQLLMAIRGGSEAVPVVLMTAHSIKSARERALGSGASCFLEKPIDDDALVACLTGVFNRSVPPLS